MGQYDRNAIIARFDATAQMCREVRAGLTGSRYDLGECAASLGRDYEDLAGGGSFPENPASDLDEAVELLAQAIRLIDVSIQKIQLRRERI